MPDAETKWVDREEAAEILGVSPKRVMAMYVSAGILQTRRKFGDTWLFLRAEIMHRKANPRRLPSKGTAIYNGPRCRRCEYPIEENGALCEDCRRQLAPPEPEEAWAGGTFEIVNPAFHGMGG